MADKAIFLDRDDTLIEDPGYINSPDQVKLLPGAGWAVKHIKKMGYKVIVVSNQSGIARGIVTEETLGQIHDRLEKLLGREDAYIDRFYYCPYHPEGIIPKFRKESDLRKPNPGMLLKAANEMDLDLEKSWMIGNRYQDVTAGVRAGCKTILVKCHGKPEIKKITDPTPDRTAGNIREAVNVVRMYDSQDKKAQEQVVTASEPQEPQEPQDKETAVITEAPEEQQIATEINISHSMKTQEDIGQAVTENNSHRHTEKTHHLLEEMLGHIRSLQRSEMFEEFSPMKFVAGILQVVVVFCLGLSLCFLVDSTRTITSVHTCIGYALVLQLMVIAFYLMRDRK